MSSDKSFDPAFMDEAQDFTGFAYESDRKPMHSHKKMPENGDSESRLVKKVIAEAKLPIFECNDRVSVELFYDNDGKFTIP